ncbi:inner centromere protein B isoform X2 [Paralichthys olivaceus]|uniref:inner centromere protein B isoform X2 n=1 Tax=Paralichthys olivaceus TaxID=8255 RepID=UPI0037536D38
MNTLLSSVHSLMQMFDGKKQEFINDIDNVHVVWLEEIQQEAKRMFSRDFNAEPELMPKTPSQKKNSRRKRVSLGRQEENQARRRFSKGKRSNLRGSSVKSLNFIVEEDSIPGPSTSEASTSTQPKRTTRKNKQSKPEVPEDVSHSPSGSVEREEVLNKKPELLEEEDVDKNKGNNAEVEPEDMCIAQSPPKIPSPGVVVNISSSDRLSAEHAKKPEPSPGRTAAKIAIAGAAQSSRRSSVRCSLKLRHSLAGLRHSLTQESIRRASRRSMLKRKAAHQGNSTCSSNISEDSCMDSAEEEDKEAMLEAGTADTVDNAAADGAKEAPEANQSLHPSVARVTRSVAANSPTLAPPPLFISEHKVSTPDKRTVFAEKHQTPLSGRRSRRSTKRKAPDTVEESPTKRFSPPKKSQSAVRPNMRSFLHTVQKNQMLMMTPNSLGRSAALKSFIKHTTPMRTDPKTKERHKLEALKKKQEQEEERMKKMEEDKKRKQEELKRKRDERLRRVFEAKVKEEQREEEKKKKIEQKMAQIDEMKNDKRVADEKNKKKVALKRQEELEQKKKLEEEARKKKIQQAEEEKRQQELLAKKKAEEEEQRVRKLAEARKALELKREQERERELERERQAAAERERVEKEKALALQRELERAARERERRELEEKRKALEEKRKREEEQRLAAEEKAAKERIAAKQREAAAAKQAAKVQATAASGLNVTVDIENSVMRTPVGKGGGLNVTVDIEQSPQSYSITPKGGNKTLTLSKSAEDYGMDQNSDDSTDDESAPRKPIPSWAEGPNLQQIIMKQYFNPPDLDSFFGKIEPPKLENIFYKSKPRYFKRTSSAVWHSPPVGE